jgi:hypothetical protein
LKKKKKLTPKQKYHRDYFHKYEKVAFVDNAEEYGHNTTVEQGYCCICGAKQTYAQSRRKRKTCGKNACIQACRFATIKEKKEEKK